MARLTISNAARRSASNNFLSSATKKTKSIAFFVLVFSISYISHGCFAARLPSFRSHDDLEVTDVGTKNAAAGNTNNPIAKVLRSNILGSLREIVNDIDKLADTTSPTNESRTATAKQPRKSSVERKALCTACKFVLHSIRWADKIGFSRTFLFGIVQEGCIEFSGKTDRVCVGLISAFKNDVHDLLSKSRATAHEICSTFFSVCTPQKHSRLNWDIIVPAPAKQLTSARAAAGGPMPERITLLQAPAGKKVLRMLHLADIHIDLLYKIGSAAVCREPQCCRDEPSDGGNVPIAGYWGFNRGFCDTPPHLLDGIFRHIAQNDKIDFIIYTGDSVPHDIWNQSRAYQLSVTATVNAAIKRHFPNIPVYATLGNHESYPVNSFPQPFVEGKNNISWLYAATAAQWIGWGPDEAQRANILKGGFYAQRPPGLPGLKIISLNTNYCAKLNWWLLLDADDPAGQMSWLVKELDDSERRGNEFVYIISHISPSGDKCIKPWRDNYYKIVARYKDIIRGTFFGHSHFDEFGVTYDPVNVSQPTSVAFIAPSITTYRHLNPGYRVFTVDRDSHYALMDHENYIVNLTDANLRAAQRPGGVGIAAEDLKFRLEYSARKLYGLRDMSPPSWTALSARLRSEPALFKTYYDNYYKQQEHWTEKVCQGRCRERLLCNTMSNACTDGDGILLW